ncbi:MAG: hypothetical protein HYV09_04940 [Deltaproteobacteria bacterium]|nr:hypothetical protein [Deltaproteobacteria bacterium]
MPAGSVSRARRATLEPLRTDGPCLHLGIDENGLGPVLGPLVVTGVAFRFEGPRPTSLGSLVGDSKDLVSHEDSSLGEAWARALVAQQDGGEPASPAELIARLCLDDEPTLRALCPSAAQQERGAAEPHHRFHPSEMCWPRQPDAFEADEALVRRCKATLRGWSGQKVGGRFSRRTPLTFVGVRSSVVCAARLNAAAREGRHRFLVDLHEMERLVLDLHGAHRTSPSGDVAPVDAVCGKVGGMDFYGENFGPLSSRMFAIELEDRRTSAYRFPGLGRVAFVQDADARDPLVGLASLVGKWLREVMMSRIVRWMRDAALPEHLGPNEIPSASGYRDPNTKRFISATELVRAHRGVPDRCFVR